MPKSIFVANVLIKNVLIAIFLNFFFGVCALSESQLDVKFSLRRITVREKSKPASSLLLVFNFIHKNYSTIILI